MNDSCARGAAPRERRRRDDAVYAPLTGEAVSAEHWVGGAADRSQDSAPGARTGAALSDLADAVSRADLVLWAFLFTI
jgi:hypothetical protein